MARAIYAVASLVPRPRPAFHSHAGRAWEWGYTCTVAITSSPQTSQYNLLLWQWLLRHQSFRRPQLFSYVFVTIHSFILPTQTSKLHNSSIWYNSIFTMSVVGWRGCNRPPTPCTLISTQEAKGKPSYHSYSLLPTLHSQVYYALQIYRLTLPNKQTLHLGFSRLSVT